MSDELVRQTLQAVGLDPDDVDQAVVDRMRRRLAQTRTEDRNDMPLADEIATPLGLLEETYVRRLEALASTIPEQETEIDTNLELTPLAKSQRKNQLRQDAAAEIQRVRGDARQARATLESAIARRERRAREEQPNDAALLAETREQRAWQRAVRALEGGRSPAGLIDEAEAEGDRDTLAALRAELPAYLEAEAAGEQGFESVLGKVYVDQASPTQKYWALTRRIDRALTPLLSEPLASAREGQQRLEAAWPRVEAALSNAQATAEGRGGGLQAALGRRLVQPGPLEPLSVA